MSRDDQLMIDDLARLLPGRVHVDPRARRRFSSDFGGVVRRMPVAVVRPRDDEDIAATLDFATRHDVPVRARGAGHSVAGQTLTNGIVISTRQTDGGVLRSLDDGQVEVSAGRRWGEVEMLLRRHRQRIPVLADHLGLTVGGTLSVGGYGMDSIVHGSQVNAVARLRLVRPDGSTRWCSQDENGDLFAASLAGLGRAGVIERVVLNTLPRQTWSAFATYAHENLQELVASLEWLNEVERPPTLFKALASGGRCISVYGATANSRREALARLPYVTARNGGRRWAAFEYRRWRSVGVRLWTARFPRAAHLWADYLLSYGGLVSFVDRLTGLQSRSSALARYLKAIFILAIHRPGTRAPLEATQFVDAPLAFGIGLYTMVPARDRSALAEVDDCLQQCLDFALRLAGRPYLYGWHRLSREQQQDVYSGQVAPWVDGMTAMLP